MTIDHQAAADHLLELRATQRVVRHLPEHLRPVDLADAYAIQDLVVAGVGRRAASRPTGYKCACTSPIAQQALHIDRPVFGRLMSHSTDRSGAVLDSGRFVHRVIEAEFGFRVDSDVGPVVGGHTHDSIRAHIGAVVPAIEIVDHRFESWTIGALPVAADNAIHGWWIHGDPIVDWQHLDLGSTAVVVERNGERVTDGSGANVLGHPLTVMAWLADELPRFGRQLLAGDLVTTGVTTDVFEASAGDRITSRFDGLGTCEVSFA